MKKLESEIIDYLLETGASFKQINKIFKMSNEPESYLPKHTCLDFGEGTINFLIDGKICKGKSSYIDPFKL